MKWIDAAKPDIILNAPKGMAILGDDLYRIENGKKVYVNTLPKGSLDGLVHLADGSFLVSSWEGKAVYRGKDNVFHAVIENVDSPADIGYDTKRHRLLVPHFTE